MARHSPKANGNGLVVQFLVAHTARWHRSRTCPVEAEFIPGYTTAMKIARCVVWGALAATALSGQEWAVYGGDGGGQRYSAASEITAKNVSKLKLAWQYGIDPRGIDLSAG